MYGKIVVIKRTGADGNCFRLIAPTCTIGKNTDCDIRIQLPGVAQKHCQIGVGPDNQIILTNLCDELPTLVNSKPVASSVVLGDKDIFTVVDRSFRWEFPLPDLPTIQTLLPPIPVDEPFFNGSNLPDVIPNSARTSPFLNPVLTPVADASTSVGRKYIDTPRPVFPNAAARRIAASSPLLDSTPQKGILSAVKATPTSFSFIKAATVASSSSQVDAKVFSVGLDVKRSNSVAVSNSAKRRRVSFEDSSTSLSQADLSAPRQKRLPNAPDYYGSPIITPVLTISRPKHNSLPIQSPIIEELENDSSYMSARSVSASPVRSLPKSSNKTPTGDKPVRFSRLQKQLEMDLVEDFSSSPLTYVHGARRSSLFRKSDISFESLPSTSSSKAKPKPTPKLPNKSYSGLSDLFKDSSSQCDINSPITPRSLKSAENVYHYPSSSPESSPAKINTQAARRALSASDHDLREDAVKQGMGRKARSFTSSVPVRLLPARRETVIRQLQHEKQSKATRSASPEFDLDSSSVTNSVSKSPAKAHKKLNSSTQRRTDSPEFPSTPKDTSIVGQTSSKSTGRSRGNVSTSRNKTVSDISISRRSSRSESPEFMPASVSKLLGTSPARQHKNVPAVNLSGMKSTILNNVSGTSNSSSPTTSMAGSPVRRRGRSEGLNMSAAKKQSNILHVYATPRPRGRPFSKSIGTINKPKSSTIAQFAMQQRIYLKPSLDVTPKTASLVKKSGGQPRLSISRDQKTMDSGSASKSGLRKSNVQNASSRRSSSIDIVSVPPVNISPPLTPVKSAQKQTTDRPRNISKPVSSNKEYVASNSVKPVHSANRLVGRLEASAAKAVVAKSPESLSETPSGSKMSAYVSKLISSSATALSKSTGSVMKVTTNSKSNKRGAETPVTVAAKRRKISVTPGKRIVKIADPLSPDKNKSAALLFIHSKKTSETVKTPVAAKKALMNKSASVVKSNLKRGRLSQSASKPKKMLYSEAVQAKKSIKKALLTKKYLLTRDTLRKHKQARTLNMSADHSAALFSLKEKLKSKLGVQSTGHANSPETIIIGRSKQASFEVAENIVHDSEARRRSLITPSVSFSQSAYNTPDISQDVFVSPLESPATPGRSTRQGKLALSAVKKAATPSKLSLNSPLLGGLKRLFAAKSSKTPDFRNVVGIRQLLAVRNSPKSPVVDGVNNLFQTPRRAADKKNAIDSPITAEVRVTVSSMVSTIKSPARSSSQGRPSLGASVSAAVHDMVSSVKTPVTQKRHSSLPSKKQSASSSKKTKQAVQLNAQMPSPTTVTIGNVDCIKRLPIVAIPANGPNALITKNIVDSMKKRLLLSQPSGQGPAGTPQAARKSLAHKSTRKDTRVKKGTVVVSPVSSPSQFGRDSKTPQQSRNKRGRPAKKGSTRVAISSSLNVTSEKSKSPPLKLKVKSTKGNAIKVLSPVFSPQKGVGGQLNMSPSWTKRVRATRSKVKIAASPISSQSRSTSLSPLKKRVRTKRGTAAKVVSSPSRTVKVATKPKATKRSASSGKSKRTSSRKTEEGKTSPKPLRSRMSATNASVKVSPAQVKAAILKKAALKVATQNVSLQKTAGRNNFRSRSPSKPQIKSRRTPRSLAIKSQSSAKLPSPKQTKSKPTKPEKKPTAVKKAATVKPKSPKKQTPGQGVSPVKARPLRGTTKSQGASTVAKVARSGRSFPKNNSSPGKLSPRKGSASSVAKKRNSRATVSEPKPAKALKNTSLAKRVVKKGASKIASKATPKKAKGAKSRVSTKAKASLTPALSPIAEQATPAPTPAARRSNKTTKAKPAAVKRKKASIDPPISPKRTRSRR